MPTINESKRVRTDAWINAFTGLGGTRDKLAATSFCGSGRVDDGTLEALFNEDDMACRICEAPIEHMLRRGYDLHTDGDPEISSRIKDWSEELGLLEAFADAMVFERLFGGAAILIGADDGQDVSQPLRMDRVRSVGYLQVLDKRDLIAKSWNTDAQSKNFGQPEIYELRRTTTKGVRSEALQIHRSRLVLFTGERSTMRTRIENDGWGESILRKCYLPLKQFQANWQAASHLMQESSISVFSIEGLIDIIASGQSDALHTRMDLVDTTKSSNRSVVIDASQEKYTRATASLAGIPDMLEQSGIRLSAAAKMPATVILGRSPAGMNATGASDIRNWYDELSTDREKCRPKLDYIIKLMFLSKEGPTRGKEPPVWRVDFPSLWQTTPEEEAKLRHLHAQTDAIRIQSGVLFPEQVTLGRFRPEGYSDELNPDTSLYQSALDTQLEALSNPQAELAPVPMTDEQQELVAAE